MRDIWIQYSYKVIQKTGFKYKDVNNVARVGTTAVAAAYIP